MTGDPETGDDDGTILLTVDAAAGRYTVAYGSRTHTFGIRGSPGVDDRVTGRVVIARLLPDPVASEDRTGERVLLANRGEIGVDLSEWFLRDAVGRVWSLSGVGTIVAGDSVRVRREGMAMSLDNDGDDIVLVDGAGEVVDSVSYTESQPGVEIVTGH